MKKILLIIPLIVGTVPLVHAQYLLSSGSYSQDFNTLANTGTANVWTDNTTLLGWYAQSTNTTIVTTDYRADTGAGNTGDLISYGPAASTDRALGSLGSGTTATMGYGLRLVNDTAAPVTDILISYVGEQWRNGGNATPQSLAFSYLVSVSPITSPNVPSNLGWISFAPLTFTSPIATAAPATLDGNLVANRVALSSILTGVTLEVGQELFVRWLDINDTGNDHGLALDDLTVTFTPAVAPEPTVGALLGGFGLLGLFMASRRRQN